VKLLLFYAARTPACCIYLKTSFSSIESSTFLLIDADSTEELLPLYNAAEPAPLINDGIVLTSERSIVFSTEIDIDIVNAV